MKKSTRNAFFALIIIFIGIGITGLNKKSTPATLPVTNKETKQLSLTITGLDQFSWQESYEYQEQTVYDLLKEYTDTNQIEITTKGFGPTIYVSSINGLAEFDHGNRSGWMYKVNGEFPNVGCGSYDLQEGDEIEWIYVTE